MKLLPLALACALVSAGCAMPIETAPGAPQESTSSGSVGTTLRTAAIAGVVRAPAGVISAGGGNVISAGSGNVISAGSGNVVSAGALNYHVAAVDEQPLAGAEVYLAKADGTRVKGLPATLTDALGNYRFPRVPAGFAYKVVVLVKTADQTPATLQSLAYAGNGGAIADVSTATTLVTAAVTQGQRHALGAFEPATFAKATEAAAAALTDEATLDLADEQAIAAEAEALQARVPELKSAVASLKAAVSTAPASDVEAVAEMLARVEAPPSPAPSSPPVGASVSTLEAVPAGALTGAQHVAVDAAGNIYFADTANHRIRKYTAKTSALTTLAGGAAAGFEDGAGEAARFNEPRGLAIDPAGNLYVADTKNHAIRVVRPDGRVETLIGTGEAGSADGAGASARLDSPTALGFLAPDTLVVLEAGRARKVTIGAPMAADVPASGEVEPDETATAETEATPTPLP